MILSFDVRQEDIKKMLAIGGVSLALIVSQAAPAFAATDSDRDGLTNAQEKITKTSPFDKDSDNDRIKDGDEDRGRDGVDNTNELRLGLKMNDANSDDDRLKDGDEDRDRDGIEDGDEDDEDDDCDGLEDEEGDDSEIDEEDEDA